jgi:hypothetical protein
MKFLSIEAYFVAYVVSGNASISGGCRSRRLVVLRRRQGLGNRLRADFPEKPFKV